MKKDKFILKACSLREKNVSSLCFQISNGQNESKAYKAKNTKIKMSDRATSTVAYLHGFIPEISFQNKYTRTRLLLL